MNYLRKSASLSECGTYRFCLHRALDDDLPNCLWIMLDPSTADGAEDDPTIRRCVAFAQSWGYGSIDVVNLFAYRAAAPAAMIVALAKAIDVIGPNNDGIILRYARSADLIVCAWGALQSARGRASYVKLMLLEMGRDLHALNIGLKGTPQHPLYVDGKTKPIIFGEAIKRVSDES